MDFWLTLVALFQFLAVFIIYLIAIHVLTTTAEFVSRRGTTYNMEVSGEDEEETDEENAGRRFSFELLDGYQFWLLQKRIEHTRLVIHAGLETRWGPNLWWTNRPRFSLADCEQLLADWKHWVMPAALAEEMARACPEKSPAECSESAFLCGWFYDRYPVLQAEDYFHRFDLIVEFAVQHRDQLLGTPERLLQPGAVGTRLPGERPSSAFLEFLLGGFIEPWFEGDVGRHLLLESRRPWAYDQTVAAFRAWQDKRGRRSH